MALTVEIDGKTVALLDTSGIGRRVLMDLNQSVSVTEHLSQTIVVADSTTDSALAFGGVSAGKVFGISSTVAVSVKLNASATAIPIKGAAVIVDSAGGITAATITNASGSSATVTYFVAG